MTKRLDLGLYEILITAELEQRLAALEEALVVERDDLDAADAANRIALHVSRTVERAIESSNEKKRAEVGIKVATELRVDPASDRRFSALAKTSELR